MRINSPVTDKELFFADEALIVSKTDLKGRITYVNQDFLDVSGYGETELIGESHNIVRHPDMPVEVFQDLWRTLKEERPWTGLIKNRCKNGDYYWVQANVAPLRTNGQVVGYISVRRKASTSAIAEAKSRYRQFREGRAGKLKIAYGQLVSTAWWRRLQGSRALTVKTRLSVMVGLFALLLVTIGIIGMLGVSQSNAGLRSVYENRLTGLSQVSAINRHIVRNRLLINEMLIERHDQATASRAAEVEQNIAAIGRLWAEFQTLNLTVEEQQVASAFAASRERFVMEGLRPSLAALRAGDYKEALVAARRMASLNEPVREQVGQLIDLQLKGAKAEYDRAQQRFIAMRNLFLAAIGLGLGFLIWFSLLLLRSILLPLKQAREVFAEITHGRYGSVIDVGRNDEIGVLLQGLQTMQTLMGFELAETKRQADAMTRVKIALDNVSTGVMIMDSRRNVIYANRAVESILTAAQAGIREVFPDFRADQLLGCNIDQLRRDPSRQGQPLPSLPEGQVTQIEIGGRYLAVRVNPVMGATGGRLGSVAEWTDRTAEIRMEQEVADIVEAASRGDFQRRLDVVGKEGFFLQLAIGLNRLFDVTQNGLADVARVLRVVADGDLTQTITNEYQGVLQQLKGDTNATIERLREVVGRIQEATHAIDLASREIAAGNLDLSSRTEEQATSLEETASAMEEIKTTVKQNAENASKANELARVSNDSILRGGEVVSRVVVTMDEIQGSSRKIADIIGMIDSIAFQTNILALNAAVEAARAGEQGRGFAVVAAEIRSLAQRSATAAKEIKGLIADSVDKIENGVALVQQAGSTMDEVVGAFQRVAGFVTDIASASAEQASSIVQVAGAVEQMDEMTQQNSALVEQAAAAAESLKQQAHGLVQVVSVFNPGKTTALGATMPKPLRADTRKQPKSAKASVLQPLDSNDEWTEF